MGKQTKYKMFKWMQCCEGGRQGNVVGAGWDGRNYFGVFREGLAEEVEDEAVSDICVKLQGKSVAGREGPASAKAQG